MSRFMYMNKRVLVEPDATPDDRNETNPIRMGEYSFLERAASGPMPTSQTDITSWSDLYDRPGDNENITLRLCRYDRDGNDWLDYLKSVPKGGVITFFPLLDNGRPDTSQWIDKTIERAGATRDFIDCLLYTSPSPRD